MLFIVLEWEHYLMDLPLLKTVCCQMTDQLQWIGKELVMA